MPAATPDDRDPVDILLDDLVSFELDPLGFVLWAFPWGEKGTSLEHERLEDWQRQQLGEIGDRLKANPHDPIREIVLSGHGIGKSADVSMLVLWATMTKVDTLGIVTANTDTQLRTKTWAQVAKWFYLLDPLLQDQFTLTATALYCRSEKRERTWRTDAIPNSPANPAAFAGAHNAGKRLLLVVDEGSEIADVIYDVLEGAMTDVDTQIIFLVYGNPTQPVGRFREYAEGKYRHLWTTRKIDSRTVRRTNKKVIGQWASAWGEDSDFFRVRVRGEFPRSGSTQLIPVDVVQQARKRTPGYIMSDPLILGVDVARFGDDQSVLAPRRGRDAKSIPWKRFRGIDTMQLASQIVLWHQELGFDAIMIDIGGLGVGVYDRVMQLNIPNVYPVNFGGEGGVVQYNNTQMKVANKRAEMWCKMREWLYLGGAIPDEDEVQTDMTGTQYSFDGAEAILLEKKAQMKARGLASPDNADALGCTFAYPIGPRLPRDPSMPGLGSVGPLLGVNVSQDYDLFADLR